MTVSRPSDEELGRAVRDEWIAWAREQRDPKPSWLISWDDLDDGQRDADMRIGRALFDYGLVVTLKTFRSVLEETL